MTHSCAALADAPACFEHLLDAGFRDRTTRVFQTWQEAYRSALARAKRRRIIQPAVDPGDAACLLVAQIEGTLSLARNSQDPQPSPSEPAPCAAIWPRSAPPAIEKQERGRRGAGQVLDVAGDRGRGPPGSRAPASENLAS